MYSQKIIEQNQAKLEKAVGFKLVRFEPEDCFNWCEHLDRLWDKEHEQWKRVLKQEEQEFIRNERLLCAIDYHYCCRYLKILRDPEVGGGLGHFVPWGPQILTLDIIAKMEEEQVEAYSRGEPVLGILIAAHKSRQLGLTALARTLLMHREMTDRNVRGITASVNDEKILGIYDRDKRMYDNFPHWLRPEITLEEKGGHIKFGTLDNLLLYQELVQKSGIAQGEQWDVGHMTEVASVPGMDFEIQHQYEPTIPRAPSSLHILETTPQGRNNWWRFFVEDIRKGFSRWKLVAIPWYAELRKYRAQPRLGWEPSTEALLHAQKVYDTSPEYVGKSVFLPKENLYWWETTRDDYRRKNNLAAFYTNYWADVAESFQHVEQSVFDSETLERLRGYTAVPQSYEIMLGEANA